MRNAVNVPSISPELLEQVRPYLLLAEKLGRFQGQLSPGAIEEIEIEYAGEVADLRVAPITVAVLKGLLESVSDRVNMVNAPIIAQEHGIKVIESKSSRAIDFASDVLPTPGGPTKRNALPVRCQSAERSGSKSRYRQMRLAKKSAISSFGAASPKCPASRPAANSPITTTCSSNSRTIRTRCSAPA